MASNRSSTFYFLSLVLALLLTVSSAEALPFGIGIGIGSPMPAPPAPRCNNVYGAKQGDTCFAVAQMFNLTPAQFSAINPNLDCDKVFIGQWLCINGTTA